VLPVTVWMESAVIAWLARLEDERGQATAEYALVLLGAGTVAALLVAWATKTHKVAKLLDAVVDRVLANVT
jgi:hypothetical protein